MPPVRLFVMATNNRTTAFYLRIGFVPTGTTIAYPPNPAFIERFQAALSHFMALGYSYVKAQAAAYAAIDQALTGQALMLSYNDSWMLILKSFLITAPAILVIRKPRGRAAAGEMH